MREVHRSEALSRDGQRVSLRTVSRVTLKVWLRSVDHGAGLDLFFFEGRVAKDQQKGGTGNISGDWRLAKYDMFFRMLCEESKSGEEVLYPLEIRRNYVIFHRKRSFFIEIFA